MKRLSYGLAGVIVLTAVALLFAVEDVKIKINDNAGANTVAIQDSDSATVASINSYGKITLGTAAQAGTIVLNDGAAGPETLTIAAPNVSGSYTLTLPTTAGTTNQILQAANSTGTLQWGPAPTLYNQTIATHPGVFETNTYLIGSSIPITPGSLKVGTRYHCVFSVSKTGLCTATPIITVVFGTGTLADTARLTFTFSAQTGVADMGTFEIWATFRSVGSGTSAVLQGTAQVRHRLSVTGLAAGGNVCTTLQVTSGGFDSTIANGVIGLCVNGGSTTANAAWTIELVQAELANFN